MAGWNQTIIIGHLGRDAEMKYTQEGDPVCNFSVAVTEKWGSGEQKQEHTEWYAVSLWGKLAETLSPYLLKGKQVQVVGGLRSRQYTKKDGSPGFSLDLRAREITLLGSRGDSDTSEPVPAENPASTRPVSQDIPF